MSSQEKAVPYRARKLVRRAYREAVTRAARLISFSVSPLFPDMDAIEDKQTELATDDLVVFSLSMRRLIELTNAKSIALNATVSATEGKKKTDPSVWDILNRIIHHRELDILRRKSDVLPLTKLTPETFKAWTEASKIGYYPVLMVRSDKGEYVGMRLTDLIVDACKKVLNPIVSYCADDDFWLEDDDLD